jgi:hypothetical protein
MRTPTPSSTSSAGRWPPGRPSSPPNRSRCRPGTGSPSNPTSRAPADRATSTSTRSASPSSTRPPTPAPTSSTTPVGSPPPAPTTCSPASPTPATPTPPPRSDAPTARPDGPDAQGRPRRGRDAPRPTGDRGRPARVGDGGWMESCRPQAAAARGALRPARHRPAPRRPAHPAGRRQRAAHRRRRPPLCDTRGVELRTIIVDHGTVVGVGRQTRRPPGWLTDIVAALHDTCTGPLCDRPARGAQLDHAVPWWPTGPDQPPGTTDVDNIGPLCRTTNQDKEAAGWLATQTADGRRRWHHPRTGLTTTSIPATWRPRDRQRDVHRADPPAPTR